MFWCMLRHEFMINIGHLFPAIEPVYLRKESSIRTGRAFEARSLVSYSYLNFRFFWIMELLYLFNHSDCNDSTFEEMCPLACFQSSEGISQVLCLQAIHKTLPSPATALTLRRTSHTASTTGGEWGELLSHLRR